MFAKIPAVGGGGGGRMIKVILGYKNPVSNTTHSIMTISTTELTIPDHMSRTSPLKMMLGAGEMAQCVRALSMQA